MFLNKRFKKYFKADQKREFLRQFKQHFNEEEYLIFLKKFRGSFISRGKSSLAYKLTDRIRFVFKKMLKKRTKQDFDLAIKKAIFNLIPVIGVTNMRKGRRIELVPILLKLRKRIVLINK